MCGLEELAVLDREDFAYAIAFGPEGSQVGFTHLGAKAFRLGLFRLTQPPSALGAAELNPYQHDVEALDFSPDGQRVVTAGRDGALRVFSSAQGTPLGVFPTEEPLVSVAFHPSGRYVVAGSARGLLTVVDFPGLRFVAEARAHRDEVRALAFHADGSLYSGSWDKSVAVFDTREGALPSGPTRTRYERRGTVAVVRATLDGRASGLFALDERVPQALVVSTALARAAGVDPGPLPRRVALPTALGTALAPLAEGRTLALKGLLLEGVELAVCDACLPPEVQGVLGGPFLREHPVAFDEQSSEAVFAAAQGASARTGLSLTERARHSFEWFVNDLSLSADGRRLGVAFSKDKAERNLEVYSREKKGVIEPPHAGNVGAVVDAQSGAWLRRSTGHRGVVSTAAISPDGRTLATGGWDRRVLLQGDSGTAVGEADFGWSVRRVRFSRDGRLLAVAAWTPQNPTGDHQSRPSAVVYSVRYRQAELKGP